MSQFLSCCFVVWMLMPHCMASKIEFTATPGNVIGPFSKTLTLRCQLNDTQPANKRFLKDTGDTDYTPFNVAHVTSIIVSREEGGLVGSVSSFKPATALVDSGHLTVSGDVSGTTGDQASLELNWSYPAENVACRYKCQINANDDHGRPVQLSTSLNIQRQTPKIEALVQQVQRLQGQVQKNQAQAQVQVLEMQTKLAKLKAPHTETGIGFCCCDSRKWKVRLEGPNKVRTYVKTITGTFKQPYAEVPTFTLGIHLIDSWDTNTRVHVYATKVTETGFVAECKTWDPSKLWSAGFQWISTVA